jgi:HAD superfamily hydrolase (TIGR01509 family)
VIATFFDFNGVLVDDEHVHLQAYRAALAPRGIPISDAAYAERYLGFDDAGAFRAILEDAGESPSDDDVRALVEAKKPEYMALIATSLKVFPGARELLRRRALRGPVAIVSGALEHEILYCLGVMGLLDLVAFVVSAEHAPRCKPDPQGYLIALTRLQHLSSETPAVVLEDSLEGIRSAKAAGLRCIAVAHTYPVDALISEGADAVATTLDEVTDALLDGAP